MCGIDAAVLSEVTQRISKNDTTYKSRTIPLYCTVLCMHSDLYCFPVTQPFINGTTSLTHPKNPQKQQYADDTTLIK